MPKLIIDNNEIEVEEGLTVLQACEIAGAEIPRFCFHERLSIAGNCRMCLVEMERAPKPIASCAMPVADGMVIKTNSEKIIKAREGVMEFLLINHPLDCPICDQGGECDLQDQAMGYGSDRSRYIEGKRAVKDKDLGPLVATVMTRCIHCTRCIRFATEIAGVPELGATGRGEHMEVGTYVEEALTSELSGNLIDLCPVGALTSKPYSFNARPWELTKTESIDVMDALGSNIRVDTRGNEVLRVVPRNHDDINQEWISDKTRFACDGLRRQRLDQPFVRRRGKLEPSNWEDAIKLCANKIKNTDPLKIASIAGDQVDCETMFSTKLLLKKIGCTNVDCLQDGAKLDQKVRSSYIFNTRVAGIDEADAVLIVGSNPRLESPVLNARIRSRFLKGGLQIGLIGGAIDLTYPYQHLGDEPQLLEQFIAGKNKFSKVLKKAKNPMIILGSGAINREDGAQILHNARKIAETTGMIADNWNGFNVLQSAASRVGGLDIGFVPEKLFNLEDMELIYLIGADEIDFNKTKNAFVVYQGHHGDNGAHHADVILPGAAYTEKSATFVNLEGRPQRTQKAVFPLGQAKEDWRIIRALSGAIDKPLPFDDLSDLRKLLSDTVPSFGSMNEIITNAWGDFGLEGPMTNQRISNIPVNFFMSDPICRASITMAECAKAQSDRLAREAV